MTARRAVLALALLPFTACEPGGHGDGSSANGTGMVVAKPATPPVSSAGTAPDAPAEWTMPEPRLNYNARQGRTLFLHYCATCHGEAGHGDGFNAYNLDPKPRDLATTEFQAQRSDAELAAVIRAGGGVSGLSTAMPPWERTLNERDIHNIVEYIRVLPPAAD